MRFGGVTMVLAVAATVGLGSFTTLRAGAEIEPPAKPPGAAEVAQRLAFVAHAAFFSLEAKQPTLVDPQAFVAAPGAPQMTGLQGIAHVAGVRNAVMVDDPERPVLSGAGKPLGFTLGRWFAAAGSVDLVPLPNGTERVAMRFTRLVANGRYSLFENHFDMQPISFTPLDGAGTANGFVASKEGEANITVIAPAPLTHANAVLLVYHSDGIDHGQSRGDIGITAQHQLIARLP